MGEKDATIVPSESPTSSQTGGSCVLSMISTIHHVILFHLGNVIPPKLAMAKNADAFACLSSSEPGLSIPSKGGNQRRIE